MQDTFARDDRVLYCMQVSNMNYCTLFSFPNHKQVVIGDFLSCLAPRNSITVVIQSGGQNKFWNVECCKH